MQVIRIFFHLATLITVASDVNAQILAEDYKGKCLVAVGANDYKTAVRECSILAHQGNRSAMSVLGSIYYAGDGVVQDYSQSFYWTRLAAEKGSVLDQGVLGSMYERGEGVKQDHIRAHMWYNIAAAGQAPNSLHALLRDSLAMKLTRDDVEIAQGMASECMNSSFQNCGD
jgi:TPR repeat protein